MGGERVRLVSLLGRLLEARNASIPQLSPTHVATYVANAYYPPAASFPSTTITTILKDTTPSSSFSSTFSTANTCRTTAHTLLTGKGAEVRHEHGDEIRVQRLQRL